jgi:hypothetical protein
MITVEAFKGICKVTSVQFMDLKTRLRIRVPVYWHGESWSNRSTASSAKAGMKL